MPEGPEIRLAADRIARVLQGEQLAQASFGVPALRRFETTLTNSTVRAVDTHGKAMLTRFDNGLTLYTHNQLYGRWYTMKRPRLPKTNRVLRVALHTQTHSALLYSATEIEVLTATELGKHPFLQRLGPDILDRDLTAATIAARLTSKRFSRRALAGLYLDQSFLAGLGNYLRSEILWVAGVSPAQKPAELKPETVQRLAQETLTISRRSYRTRGVTLAPQQAAALKGAGKTYQQYRFHVFGREGLPCYHCGATIERRVLAGRNIFVCDVCQ